MERELSCQFPDAYRTYMVDHDGRVGRTEAGVYLDIWPIHHLVYMNHGSPQADLHPDL